MSNLPLQSTSPDSRPRRPDVAATAGDRALRRASAFRRALRIVIDTREQNPLDFSPFPDVRTVRAELWPGDYSLQAATRLVAVERKSVSDLVGTMTGGYAGFGATTPKRFDRELAALCGYPRRGGRAFVLVEPDVSGQTAGEQILSGNYRAMIEPSKVMAFVQTIRDRWLVDVVFADSREHAAEIVVAAVRPFALMKAANREVAASASTPVNPPRRPSSPDSPPRRPDLAAKAGERDLNRDAANPDPF